MHLDEKTLASGGCGLIKGGGNAKGGLQCETGSPPDAVVYKCLELAVDLIADALRNAPYDP